MTTITPDYINRAEFWLCLTTLAYFMMNGAQIFETAVIVPKWTADPPASFTVFKGRYALDFKTFWIAMHSVHEITFIAAIAFCWQLVEVRSALLLLFSIHFVVRVWTIGYFAPNIIEFQRIANEDEEPMNLLQKTKKWRRLNYLRVGIFIAVSVALIPVCIQILKMK